MSGMERGAALDALSARLPEFRRVQESTGGTLEVVLARVERPESRAAVLLEGTRIQACSCPATSGPVFQAFLDGIQESRVAGWLGTTPLVFARTAAVVRVRETGRFSTWRSRADRMEALYAPWSRLSQRQRALAEECGFTAREVRMDSTEDAHPLRVLQDASNAVKQDREALEGRLASAWAGASTGTLYVDGGVPANAEVQQAPGIVGVVKSHQTLYADGEGMAVILGLQEGERTSAFLIESRHRPPVASWYYRIRDAAGRDPFFGLVRVEVPFAVWEVQGPGLADERSSWIAAERSPIALPDGRWDTMAYGIRDCEEYLRATL